MKSNRHERILQLVTEEQITTQDELLIRLKQSGFEVTQATVSRDIKELQLLKTLSSDGKYRYTVSESTERTDMKGKYQSIMRQSIKGADYAQNIVVLKCYDGMANAACAAIDKIYAADVVGTLAGDDTIFILLRNEDHAVKFVEDIKKTYL